MSSIKRFLIVSNGYGEDQIACNLIEALRAVLPDGEYIPVPLVGAGLEYQRIGLEPVIQNDELPSGGFVRSVGMLIQDVFAGLPTMLIRQYRYIRQLHGQVDGVIAVGDVFCLAMAGWKSPVPVMFLPTAKSDLFLKHSILERRLIRQIAKQVYTRDKVTASAFQQAGIPARFLGNPMTDLVELHGWDFGFAATDFVVGILPGSRKEAYDNLLYILDILQRVDTLYPGVKYLVARAKSVELDQMIACLEATSWRAKQDGESMVIYHPQIGLKVYVANAFADVLAASHCVIGLAGTANEQAVYLGRSVLCFPGKGPQSSSRRFYEQKRLLGSGLTYVDDTDPDRLSVVISGWLRKQPRTKKPLSIPEKAAPNIVKDILAGN